MHKIFRLSGQKDEVLHISGWLDAYRRNYPRRLQLLQEGGVQKPESARHRCSNKHILGAGDDRISRMTVVPFLDFNNQDRKLSHNRLPSSINDLAFVSLHVDLDDRYVFESILIEPDEINCPRNFTESYIRARLK